MKDGKRITERGHKKHLYNVCDKLGIKRKSPHKARRTYATMLIDSEADDSTTMEQLGHKDILTTKNYYYFSNKSDQKKQEQINRAVNL